MDWTLLLAECLGPRFAFKGPALIDLYFENLHTSYAEVSKFILVTDSIGLNIPQSKIRQSIISTFLTIMSDEVPYSDDATRILSHSQHSGGQNSLTLGLY